MSDFSRNFNHGFYHGIVDRMFGGFGAYRNFNPLGCCYNKIFHNNCGLFNPFGGYSGLKMFFMPNLNFNYFYQYPNYTTQIPFVENYSMPNFSPPEIRFNESNLNYASFPMPNYFFNNYIGDSFVRTSENQAQTVKKSSTNNNKKNEFVARNDNDFDKMLSFVLKSEGGYNPNDNGSPSNKGVKKETYDTYRTKKGLPKRDVSQISDSEVKEIYYEMYYKASGADKIKDARMALYVFDTAVNMGVSRAEEFYEKSNGSLEKFKELRLAKYNSLAESNKEKYGKNLKGWKNRIENLVEYAENKFVA